uniref:MOSC domain-containing protein n=2 Tax=Timema TaxID=61471 RepID=A0A7R9K2U1_TIMGE|nr:unnamed protein product [Timema genevievae]
MDCIVNYWWWRQRKGDQKPPSRWRRVGELAELTVFPLKSGRGVRLEEADCTEIGLRTREEGVFQLRDRFFLAYDERNGEFKTARTFPKMVLITVTAKSASSVMFEAPGMPPILVDIPDQSRPVAACKMWANERILAADCGDEVALWLSRYILDSDKNIRLGYYLTTVVSRRKVVNTAISKRGYSQFRDKDLGAYSDLSGYMMMAESSVVDLAARVEGDKKYISASRFRGNFVVRGSNPYEEDTWDWVKIGDSTIFRNFKPCTRCILTTVDPETGVLDPDKEPLRTLETYRQLDEAISPVMGQSPALGINLGLYTPGIVKVGDAVYVNCD